MTPYTVSTGDIPTELLSTFYKMRATFERLPDFEDELITCHAICSAFAQHFNLTCVDGYWGTGNEHSWIINPKYPKVIIDMYPIGGATPFIIFKHWILPWDKLYIQKPLELSTQERERQVTKILSAIQLLN